MTTPEQAIARVRELALAARPALSAPPYECTNACFSGACDCDKPFRALGWDLDPAVVLAALDGMAPPQSSPAHRDATAAPPAAVAGPPAPGGPEGIVVVFDDLLDLWQLATGGLDADHGPFAGEWVQEQVELLDRVAEQLNWPCRVCNLTGGNHKMDCYERVRGGGE